MSKKAVNFVFRLTRVTSSEKLVMFVLAVKHDDRAGYAQLNKSAIQKHTSLGYKTVGSALASLADKKLIERVVTKSQKGHKYVILGLTKNADKDAMLEQMFEDFWQQYPNKKNKMAAKKAYWALNPSQELAITILTDLVDRMYHEWSLKETQYIPHPSTYLNQHRWEDEIDKREADPNDNGGFIW